MNKLTIPHALSSVVQMAAVAAVALFLSACGYVKVAQKALLGPSVQKVKIDSVTGTLSITEGQSFALTIALSAPVPSSQILSYVITSTQGDENVRFVASAGAVVIADGAQTATVVIQTNNDSIYQGTESFTLDFASSDEIEVGTNGHIAMTLIDDDASPQVRMAATGLNVNEGDGTVLIPVTLSRASSHAISVDYAVTFGTASSADVGTPTSGTVTFAAGETSKNISVSIVDDALVESGETFTANLSNIVGTATMGGSSRIITIIDNDYPNLSINSVSVNEGNTASFTISLSVASASDVTVDWATSDGTAVAGTGYTSASGTVTIPHGSLSATVNVSALANANVCASDKTFNVDLSNSTNATIGSATGVGTIIDLDIPSISVADASVTEGSSGTITATLSQSCATHDVTFKWITSNGTGTSGSDYTAVPLTSMTITAGSTTKSLSVSTTTDALDENDETVNVTISAPSGATLGTSTSVLTILDNNSPPTLSINDVTVNENAGTASLTVSLSAVSGRTVTFQYDTADATATAGNDYTALTAQTGTIAAGSTTTTVTISITNDTLSEASETFNVVLSNPANATIADATGVVTITDNDTAPTLAIDSPTVTEGTGAGSTTLTFTVTLAAASGQTITVNYTTASGTATSATDFTAASGTLTFAPGDLSKTVDVTVAPDALYENNETFTMTLSGGGNYTSSGSTLVGTGTINDDDTAPTVQWTTSSQSGYESGGALTITAELSTACGRTVSVPFTLSGTATYTADYTISSSPVTIAAGSTTTTVTITPVDDSTNESDETVIVTMGTPTNAMASGTTVHTATILNDDMSGFSVTGVQSAGGLDTTSDAYLNYESAPRFLFGASTGATSYDVTVFASDGTTVICTAQNTSSTTFDPSSCSLTPGSSYKLKVTAKLSTFTRDAANSPYTFVYNRATSVTTRGTWLFNTATSRTFSVLIDDPATGANDPITDPDGDTLSLTAVTQGSHGTVTFNGTSKTVTYGSAANYDGTDSFTFTLNDGRGAISTITVNVGVYSQAHWTGAGADALWSTAANWCGSVGTTGAGACGSGGGAVPTSSTIAVFDSSCVQCDVTVSAAASALGVEMRSGYGGTITQTTGSMTIYNSGWTQTAGAFVGTNTTGIPVEIRGDWFVGTGTTFTAPRGDLILGRTPWNYATEAVMVYAINGTFNHNSGNVKFVSTISTGSGGPGYSVGTLDVSANVDFYNIYVQVYNTIGVGFAPSVKFVDDTDFITVKNNLYFDKGTFRYGNINLEGNLYASCAATNTCSVLADKNAHVKIHFIGSADSTYTVSDNTTGTPQLGEIWIEKNTDAIKVSSSDNRTIQFAGLNLIKGEFVAPTSTLKIGRRMQNNAPEMPINNPSWGFIKSGGVFTHSGGTVNLTCVSNVAAGGFNLGSSTCLKINVSSAVTFKNLIMDANNIATAKNGNMDVTATADILVDGDLTINDGYFNGDPIKLKGNLIATCADYTNGPCARRQIMSFGSRSPTEITFVGSAAQTYNIAANARISSLVVEKDNPTDTVSPDGASYLAAASIEAREGILNLPAGETRIGLVITSSTTLGRGIKIGTTTGTINHNSGTVIFDGLAVSTGLSANKVSLSGRSLTLNNLIVDIEKGSAPAYGYVNFVNGETLSIAGNMTVESGYIDSGTGNPTVPSIDLKGDLVFKCSSATVHCAEQRTGSVAGLMLQMSGTGQTLTQASGASVGLRRLKVNLPTNSDVLNLGSSINLLSPVFGYFIDLYMTKGQLKLNGYTATNVRNLDVTAGATCTAALTYQSSSGATGSGCGP